MTSQLYHDVTDDELQAWEIYSNGPSVDDLAIGGLGEAYRRFDMTMDKTRERTKKRQERAKNKKKKKNKNQC
jgi:hypothetical protein